MSRVIRNLGYALPSQSDATFKPRLILIQKTSLPDLQNEVNTKIADHLDPEDQQFYIESIQYSNYESGGQIAHVASIFLTVIV